MRTATSYSQWIQAALEADRLDGKEKWRAAEHCTKYDALHIRQTIEHLRTLRSTNDVETIISTWECSLSTRNLANSGHPDLYYQARSGTKLLIDEFTTEVVKCVTFVRDCRATSPRASTSSSSTTPGAASATANTTGTAIRISALTRVQRTVGHTALCLSGGGALSLYHFGVIKSLLEQALLPKVLSGSSGGAIVAAWVGCQSPEELKARLTPELIARTGVPMSDPFHVELKQLLTTGVLRKTETLMKFFKAFYGDLTFEEAYHKSRRVIAISITNKRSGSEPPLLSYLTSPQVLVRSAVQASCSLPFLIHPTTLLAKDRSGNIVPYEATGGQWIDGSFSNDVPATRLSELFNVTQCIVAQVNPHIVMFMPKRHTSTGFVETVLDWAASMVHRSIKFRYFAMKSTGLLKALDMYDAVLSQIYTSDVTIIPDFSYLELAKSLETPTVEYMTRCINLGMLATYPHMAIIRNRTAVERAIDEALQVLRKSTFINAANRATRKMSVAVSGSKSTPMCFADVAKRLARAHKASASAIPVATSPKHLPSPSPLPAPQPLSSLASSPSSPSSKKTPLAGVGQTSVVVSAERRFDLPRLLMTISDSSENDDSPPQPTPAGASPKESAVKSADLRRTTVKRKGSGPSLKVGSPTNAVE
eukprot:CAMPEP_0184652136 /NCGR_PEP_ID=MMETSP0308-20130426/9822_1 /TAXON_ID=38269 /ORGANISM="Gloeochaete witrockiana, Strain SAG 46.84" /LENGTH=648 /DNA_ID=CAMNT_0027086825 /DNA_START=388 /DNA_END=2331 /DNA_ORIENTATION=+